MKFWASLRPCKRNSNDTYFGGQPIDKCTVTDSQCTEDMRNHIEETGNSDPIIYLVNLSVLSCEARTDTGLLPKFIPIFQYGRIL